MKEHVSSHEKKQFLPGNQKKRVIAIGVVLVLALAFKFIWGPGESAELKSLVFSGRTMATTWEVKVVDFDFSEKRKALLGEKIQQKLAFVNSQMSPYHEGGDIYRLNAAKAGEQIKVHREVLDVLNKAIEVSEQTHGAFDVTVGPLIRLWGFHDKKSLTTEPSTAQIAEASARIGYKNIVLDYKNLSIHKRIDGLDVDLSAIAKGRAVDMVAEVLDAANETNYMVEVGGEIRCRGKNDRGHAWRIGIEKPAAPNARQRSVNRVVSLSDISLATSGDYRSYYMLHNRRFSHTIDPRTGRPVAHSLASVSVFTRDCMTADALATGFTVLGVKESLRLADKRGIAAYFIEREANGFAVTASKAFTAAFGEENDK
ncbi:MAG: FAD:protein FMN transferase [Deltaproteobacteria bacterium]|nr:FAD:protein FMN transferase [Deltaproteobacteria bacterium]